MRNANHWPDLEREISRASEPERLVAEADYYATDRERDMRWLRCSHAGASVEWNEKQFPGSKFWFCPDCGLERDLMVSREKDDWPEAEIEYAEAEHRENSELGYGTTVIIAVILLAALISLTMVLLADTVFAG